MFGLMWGEENTLAGHWNLDLRIDVGQLTPVPGDGKPSSGLLRHLLLHTQTTRRHTGIHMIRFQTLYWGLQSESAVLTVEKSWCMEQEVAGHTVRRKSQGCWCSVRFLFFIQSGTLAP